MSTEQGTKASFYTVAFCSAEKPAYFDPQKPGAAAVQLAQEKFSLPPADFNPKHGGRFYGEGRNGFTFEVQIKWESAQALAVKSYPDVLNIFE